MHLETRRQRQYVYRKVREGTRVRSIYVGRLDDPAVRALYDADRARREARRQLRALRDQIAQRRRELRAQLAALPAPDLLYRHRGQWRKRRLAAPTAPTGPTDAPLTPGGTHP